MEKIIIRKEEDPVIEKLVSDILDGMKDCDNKADFLKRQWSQLEKKQEVLKKHFWKLVETRLNELGYLNGYDEERHCLQLISNGIIQKERQTNPFQAILGGRE